MLSRILLILMLMCSPCWGGIDFDGTDDFIDVGSTNIPTVGPISIYAVIKPDTTTAGLKIVSRWDDNSDTFTWMLDQSASSGYLRWIQAAAIGASVIVRQITTSNTYSGGDIVRVVAVSDSATGAATFKINMNGTEASTGSTLFSGATDIANITIGAGRNGAARSGHFDGKIFEVAIWDIELTSHEMQQLVGARVKGMPLQIQPGNIQSYWSFDEQPDGTSFDGDTLYDTISGNDGTGDDGANNTGLTAKAEEVLSYP